MTRRNAHLCATLVNLFNLFDVMEIKLWVNALRPHIECKSDDVNIARSLAVAEQCALNSVCTRKQTKLGSRNACSSVVVRMKRNDSCISVWQMTAKILDLVSVTVRC